MGKQRLAHLFLHIINIIYLMSGATVLTFGIIGLSSPSTIVNMFSYIPGFNVLTNVLVYEGLSLATAIYFTSLGSVVLVLSFVGGVGTLSEHKIILYIYGITKLFLVLFQLATIVFNAVDPNWMEPNVKNAMTLKLEQGYSAVIIDSSDNNTIAMPSREEDSAWAIMQLENACCGVENYTDYLNNPKISEQPWKDNYSAILDHETAQIPLSCCTQRVQYKVATSTDDFIDPYYCLMNPPSYVNSHGCAHVVMDVILQYNYAYVIVAAGFVALEVISVALTVHIVRSKDNKVGPI